MCGRYALRTGQNEITRAFGVAPPLANPPRYNIAPSQPVMIIRQDPLSFEPKRQAAFVQWGLIPSWAKDSRVGGAGPFINARAETVPEKASFRTAFQRRRCLVPADGFYEWRAEKGAKQPYFFTLDEAGSVFALAGLWELWQGAEGSEIETLAIITRAAGPAMAPYHKREPLLIGEAHYDDWLSGDEREIRRFGPLLDSPPPAWRVTRVSRAVNNVGNEDASLVEPVADDQPTDDPPSGSQASLF